MTKNGNYNEMPEAVVVSADIIDLNNKTIYIITINSVDFFEISISPYH